MTEVAVVESDLDAIKRIEGSRDLLQKVQDLAKRSIMDLEAVAEMLRLRRPEEDGVTVPENDV